jgi:hypothetical protein
MDNPQHNKTHKGGEIVRTKPYDMQLLIMNPLIREAFQRVGCINFCQKMQRGHPEVAREFALNFNGTKTKVGILEFEVSDMVHLSCNRDTQHWRKMVQGYDIKLTACFLQGIS